ncbi:MAG: tetratricopeptide repeat protein [Nodosilinea sp. WJT8-NPBG4]|jgi:tetratricopeptide (TPR) repeat protein|nr:tetratricopeptide repeat protein [Nodosilinea sp. WJT8-NPBG4]
MPQQPYVSRPEAEEFLAALDTALKAPAINSVVFHVWGIGGVGKSTLTRKVRETFKDTATFADVSFGLTENVDEPIPLMAKLYEQIAVSDSWSRDPFWDKYNLYFETVHQLNTQAATGRGDATPEQVNQVKTLVQLGVDVAGEFFLSESAKKTANTVVDKGMDAAVAGLSLKDSVQQLLQQHKATRRNQELQTLMLEPLPQLTRAFAEGLCQHTRQAPIILVLDTYEKAPTVVDSWLWRTLLGNTDIANYGVRLLIAGRHLIKRGEGWRKLHQDRSAVYDRTIKRFDLPQTQNYLAQIQRGDEATVERIYGMTKGLPYYLNWIREQLEKGQNLDFDQGNQEIVRLLLQGLNDTQKLLVQLAACCRRFDVNLIRYLTEQQELDFATAADEKQNCFGWLTQLSFVESVGKHWRLDDVARDIFRQSLDQTELERVHGQLAHYFLTQSDQEVAPESAPPQKYNNPDWRALRADYLYHLLFTRQSDLQTEFISHLLEARHFSQDELVQAPFQATVAEFELADHPLLRHSVRQFLQQVRPAVEYGWAVLEEVPLDCPHNEEKHNLSKAETDLAVQVCLGEPQQLKSLAKFVALVYKSGRCPEFQSLHWLQQAQDVAQSLIASTEPDFSSGLFLWELGNRYPESGRYEEAIAAYDQALAIKPDKHEALYNKGYSLSVLGRYEEAIAAYDQTLAIKPNLHEALYNKGYSLSVLGRYEEAIAAYDQALAIKPDKHEALYNKGYSLDDLGRYEEAIMAYDQALAIKPDKHEALNNKGYSLDDLGRYEEAIMAYDQALAIKPDYPAALNNKGGALSALGHYEEAIAAYDQALVIKPDYPAALYNKGNALDDLGRKEEAIAAYDQALVIKPDYPAALYNKGGALDDLGRKEEAIAAYDQALAIKSDYHNAFASRGSVYRRLGQPQQALADLNRAIELKPDYDWAIATRGQTYGQLQQYEAALQDLDCAIDIAPEWNWAIGYRGELYLWLQRYENAIAAFNQTLENDLSDDWTHYLRALGLAKTGGVQDVGQSLPAELPSASEPALQDLTQAIQLAQTDYEKDPNDWHNHFNLALYHLVAGHYVDAHTLYEAGLNASPTWAIGMAHQDLRDYLRLFPDDKTASHWCDRLQK